MKIKQGYENVLESDLKSPEFVEFGANLTHFGPECNTPKAKMFHWYHSCFTSIRLFWGYVLPKFGSMFVCFLATIAIPYRSRKRFQK